MVLSAGGGEINLICKCCKNCKLVSATATGKNRFCWDKEVLLGWYSQEPKAGRKPFKKTQVFSLLSLHILPPLPVLVNHNARLAGKAEMECAESQCQHHKDGYRKESMEYRDNALITGTTMMPPSSFKISWKKNRILSFWSKMSINFFLKKKKNSRKGGIVNQFLKNHWLSI